MRRYLIRFGIAALWIAFIALAWFSGQKSGFAQGDYRVYYAGAHLLLNGQPLYHGSLGSNYIYPPLLAQLLMPVAAIFSVDQVWLLWFGLNILLLIGTIVLLNREDRRARWLWLITPFFMPMLEALGIGQVTILLLALFAAIWLAVKHERRFLAGSLLALAAWIKVFPALVILYFIWKRDWRVVCGAVVSGIALGLLQIAISGVTPMIGMLSVLFSLTSNGQQPLVITNASVLGFTSQLFQAHPDVAPLIVSPALYLISRATLTLILLGGLLYFTRGRDQREFDLEYGLALLTSLLLSPTLFPTSMPPVLLSYFLLLRRQPTKRMVWFCTLACIVLSIYWLYIGGYNPVPPTSALLLSFGFYTLLITWGVNAFLLRKPTKISVAENVEGDKA